MIIFVDYRVCCCWIRSITREITKTNAYHQYHTPVGKEHEHSYSQVEFLYPYISEWNELKKLYSLNTCVGEGLHYGMINIEHMSNTRLKSSHPLNPIRREQIDEEETLGNRGRESSWEAIHHHMSIPLKKFASNEEVKISNSLRLALWIEDALFLC